MCWRQSLAEKAKTPRRYIHGRGVCSFFPQALVVALESKARDRWQLTSGVDLFQPLNIEPAISNFRAMRALGMQQINFATLLPLDLN